MRQKIACTRLSYKRQAKRDACHMNDTETGFGPSFWLSRRLSIQAIAHPKREEIKLNYFEYIRKILELVTIKKSKIVCKTPQH
jgi:hypothetical protein